MKAFGRLGMMGLLAFAASGRATAQEEQPPAIPIVVRPAAEPVPALSYRLIPPRRSLEPGNAALDYHRAIVMVLEARRASSFKPAPGADAPPSPETQVSDWNALPLDQLPVEQAVAVLASYRSALAEVERGARREACDWGLSLRPEGIDLLLPEIQEMRTLSRLVTLQTRVAIRQGKLDEAWHWIQVGLALGRHTGDGDIIIQALVGVAITSSALSCVEEFIQAPGAPNLYWALANRPRPFVDMRPALEGEMTILEREFPLVETLDKGVWSLDQARRFSAAVGDLMTKVAGVTTLVSGPMPRPSTAGARLGLAVMAAKLYPEAKAALVASGTPPTEVEAMPVIQVSALHAYRLYQKERDDRFKWLGLPYTLSFGPLSKPAAMTPQEGMANPLLAMFALLEPSLNQARLAELRLERHLDALQAIEAIRLHAAANNGALPASLEEITIVPVLPNPITGKPFDYKTEGDTAELSAPSPPGVPSAPRWVIRYALKRVK